MHRTQTIGAAGFALALLCPLAMAQAARVAAPVVSSGPTQAVRIVAIVNGRPITNDDVSNRTRLFAIASGLPVSADTLDRLRPQITRQLIDEQLRMQEAESLHIVISDKEVAAAIQEVEAHNGMRPGDLRKKLDADGVSFVTLVDQLRTQLGWTQVLRQKLGERANVSDAEVAEQQRVQAQMVGKPEYRVAEIFIPGGEKGNASVATSFAETVIKELRAGAPFAVVAAQFSQSQTALQGGDLGWVQPNQLDPGVAKLVAEMPPGAVSNPIPVPGGVAIVTLIAKRQIGNDIGTVLSVRQVFLPFSTPLNPQAPTPAQMALLEKAKSIAASTKSCPEMEAVAKQDNSPRPADPGDLRLEQMSPPAFREMMANLPLDTASKPLVSPDGIAVMMVCSRDQKNLAQMSAKDIKEQLFIQRVDLLSRQLLQDLRNQSQIEMRNGPGTT